MTMPINEHHGFRRLVEEVDPDGHGVRELFRSAETIDLTPDLVRRLIERRLQAADHTRSHERRRIVRLVAAVWVAFGFGGLVGAATYKHLESTVTGEPSLALRPSLREPKHTGQGLGKQAAVLPAMSPVDLGVSTTSPLGIRSQAPEAPRTLRRRPASHPIEIEHAPAIRNVVPASPSEQDLLSAGLHLLRAEKDPELALKSLDGYEQSFPFGALGAECKAIRAEALVLLGRKREAISVLSTLLSQRVPGSDERRVLRAELYVGSGQYAAAIVDLDRALMPGVTADPGAFERALWARAVAYEHLGNKIAAQRDLDEYLRQFPQGRFAASARTRQTE